VLVTRNVSRDGGKVDEPLRQPINRFLDSRLALLRQKVPNLIKQVAFEAQAEFGSNLKQPSVEHRSNNVGSWDDLFDARLDNVILSGGHDSLLSTSHV